MNLIDRTYFVNDINLPASALQGTPAPVEAYIERYEKEVLINLLGYDLYKLLKAEIDASTYTAKWDELVNGHEYVISGYTTLWNGLINSDKVSLIAYYIFWNYVRDNLTSLENVGVVASQSENSLKVSPDALLADAWNNYVNLYNEAIMFILANQVNYPLWIAKQMKSCNSLGI
jgi:hypothetical protein